MQIQQAVQKPTSFVTNSITLKILTIGILVGVFLLPSAMIQSLISEREQRKQAVITEISSKWGAEQLIAGPILSIPYNMPENKTGYIHVLPDELTITTDLTPEIRYRGIYETVLYGAKIRLSGSFSNLQANVLEATKQATLGAEAALSIGIADLRGISEKIAATVNEQPLMLTAGIKTPAILQSGVSAKINLFPTTDPLTFDFTIKLNGSYAIRFVPVGAFTSVAVTSSWTSPSFDGAVLPVERTITNEGFQAKWSVFQVNRNYPQVWIGNEYPVDDSAFGVALVIPVDIYQKSMRAAKYSFIFVIFTFLSFFLAEILNHDRIHPIQYLLIGFAIMVFYTLLISISEHLAFPLAYLIASLGVTLLITGYSRALVDSKYFPATVFGILTLLYGYLYTLLQLEDFALLMGSVGFFVILGIVMFVTRHIDWYALRPGSKAWKGGEAFDEIDLQSK